MDRKTVQKVARLARLRLTEEETDKMATELSTILHWVEQLQEVNTDGVPELASVANITLPMREDVVTDGNCREAVLANAPKVEFDCFAVPKVIE